APLLPFFAVGAAAGVFTLWVERRLVGAEGAAFDLTALQRVLIAGRAAWFYLGKLVWPANLVFIYPRWQVSQSVWWQYLYPAAAVATLAALTWKQSRLYADAETLYRATIRDNPACWMAYNNLSGLLIARGGAGEADRLARKALELRPDYPEAHNNLALALVQRGQPD